MAGAGVPSLTLHAPQGQARRTAALTLCCAGAFMAFLDTTIVNVAFPDIESTFHASAGLSTLSWVVNGYNVVIAAFLVPAGRLADRVGHRRSFIAGLLSSVLARRRSYAASQMERPSVARATDYQDQNGARATRNERSTRLRR